MTCPLCGSNEYNVLKSKGKKIKQITAQCSECNHVYQDTVKDESSYEINVRIIVSEFERSWKSEVSLYSDEYLEIGTVLYVNDKDIEVTSIENKKGIRVNECPVIDIETIWAKSLDKPIRLGVSIDNHGTVFAHKIEVDSDYIFTIGDVVTIRDIKFQIYGFKTLERRMKKGYAYAKVIKRIYGNLLPPKDKSKVKYDLTEYVVKTTVKEKKY